MKSHPVVQGPFPVPIEGIVTIAHQPLGPPVQVLERQSHDFPALRLEERHCVHLVSSQPRCWQAEFANTRTKCQVRMLR